MNVRFYKLPAAARNVDGLVLLCDTMTESMQRTIDETNRRREKQMGGI